MLLDSINEGSTAEGDPHVPATRESWRHGTRRIFLRDKVLWPKIGDADGAALWDAPGCQGAPEMNLGLDHREFSTNFIIDQIDSDFWRQTEVRLIRNESV